MPNKYYEAISNIKLDEKKKAEIIQKLKEENVKNKGGIIIMNKVRKIWMTIGAVAGIAVCGGLAYAGLNSNKPNLEDYGISFTDNYNEYEYTFESQAVESNGTTIKLESAMCNEGFTVLKFDITLSEEIKQHADETCGLIYLSYNDEIEKGSNFPRLGGANYNLIIDGKKQWLRARYDNEIRENIINKNYTDYELYFLTDSMLGNKNKFSVTLKDFRLNVGEKLYEIPGKLEFELDKNKALKATTEIAGNNETIKYKSMEEKIEKVIKTPLQNVVNVKQEVGEITFDLTDERYVGDIEYEVFDQNGNKLISKFFDTDIKYIHKDGTIEQGEVGDGKENYNDIAKIVYEKSIVAEKSDNITSLIIKVYSINEYYGTRKQIGEYKADLKNNSIITETTKENIIQEIADVNDEERIQLSDIQDFSINLNDGVTSVTKINYTTGNKNKKIEVVGYEISINHEGYFTIVVMDKDKDYVFKSLSSNNVEQEKIKENNTKKAVLLKETYSSYNKYKTIIDQIELK